MPAVSVTEIPSLLVVDDDGEILALVAKFVRRNGFRVHMAREGVEMTEALGRAPVDLIVLDLMPGIIGIGFEVGADDYRPTPFNPGELLARVNAVLRRSRGGGAQADRAGRGFAFDFARRCKMMLSDDLRDPRADIPDVRFGPNA